MQSLKKETDGNRKNGYNKNSYDRNYKKNYQNQNQQDRMQKQPAYSVPLAQLEDLLNDNLVSLKKLMEQFIETQKHLLENEQKRSRLEDEKAANLKNIADMLAMLINRQVNIDTQTHQPQQASSISNSLDGNTACSLPNHEYYRYITVNRNDVIQKIFTLREQGLTYRLIAEHLEMKGIPTFSGRGGWHAQTIANLIKFNKTE
jgi:hypothetical protein